MSKIGIVICNFNKKEYLENCIQSILKQTTQDFTIYVSDNASTDGSVAMVQNKFGNQIELLVSKENRGGAGGFNAGIRKAMQNGHDYIMLVDNDIVMDKNNIKNLLQCLQENLDIGIVGSKILKMDFPDIIQEYGSHIDFENLNIKQHFINEKNRNDLPKLQYCDHVPACSLMIRTNIIKDIGEFPEDNFIYWDDIEWGWKCNLAGYKVAAYNDAVVWHKGGVSISTSTFPVYYNYRNKFIFFAKYTPKEKRMNLKEKILLEYFRAVYACYYTNKINRVKTLMNAFDDTLHNIKGKCSTYKIRPVDAVEDAFEKFLGNKRKVYIICEDITTSNLQRIISKIRIIERKKNHLINITLVTNIMKSTEKNFFNYQIISKLPDNIPKDTILFKLYPHIFSVKEECYKIPILDEWCNIISSEKELLFCKNFESNYFLFRVCYEDILDEWLNKILVN